MSCYVYTSRKVSAGSGPGPAAQSAAGTVTHAPAGAQPDPAAQPAASGADRPGTADPAARDAVRVTGSSGPDSGLLPGLGLEAGPEPVVLVLGTFPSAIARREQAYYANPRNQFWPIMERLFGIPRTLPYRDRVAALNGRGLALWDTVAACRQEGSMDHTIRDPVLNDVAGWLAARPSVGLVAVNGRTAERFLHRALCGRTVGPHVRIAGLPSTSPANAGTTFEEKLHLWSVVRDHARVTRSSRS